MAKLTCEICGGDTLLKEESQFRCARCGACYTPEHLKQLLDKPEAEEPVIPQPEEMPKEPETQEAISENCKGKYKTIIGIVVMVAVAISFFMLIFYAVLSSYGVIPKKSATKDVAESYIEHRIANENVTLTDVRFDSVEAVKFYTREEDRFGYFQYLELPVTVVDQYGNETKYESHFEQFRDKLGELYDPETDIKWAYTLTGTYEANHKEYGDTSGEFYIIYVHNMTENCWYPVKSEFRGSEEVLRQDVNNQLMAYLLLNYDIKPNPSIRITSVDNDQNNFYTVYGTVSVTDNFGDKYHGKFTAEYYYSSYDQHFEKQYLDVGELCRSPLFEFLD